MNVGRVLYRAAQVYVAALVGAGVVTGTWLLNPSLGASPEVAGLWFAVGGFGLLVLVTIILVHVSR